MATAKKAAPKKATTSDTWQSATLDRMRKLIMEAAPAATEVRKWAKATNPVGVPVWEQDGIICTGEKYKDKVKLTFMHGAALPDPAKLFNADDKGATRRTIDIREGAKVDEKAFKALVKAAVALNTAKAAPKPK